MAQREEVLQPRRSPERAYPEGRITPPFLKVNPKQKAGLGGPITLRKLCSGIEIEFHADEVCETSSIP